MWSVHLSKLGTSHSIHERSSRGSYASRWSWKSYPLRGQSLSGISSLKTWSPSFFLGPALPFILHPIPPSLPTHPSLALSPRSSSSIQPALSNLRRIGRRDIIPPLAAGLIPPAATLVSQTSQHAVSAVGSWSRGDVMRPDVGSLAAAARGEVNGGDGEMWGGLGEPRVRLDLESNSQRLSTHWFPCWCEVSIYKVRKESNHR